MKLLPAYGQVLIGGIFFALLHFLFTIQTSYATVEIRTAFPANTLNPATLTATAALGSVKLVWVPPEESANIVGYMIYRNRQPLTTVMADTLSFIDTDVQPATTYRYMIVAYDAANNLSAPSPLAIVATPFTKTMVLSAAADAYVNIEEPNHNFGGTKALHADAIPEVRSYICFDIQGLTGEVLTATLRLFANTPSIEGYSVSTVMESAWSEARITYNSAPPLLNVIGSTNAYTVGWTEVDITPLFEGNGLYSLAVTTGSSTLHRFSSRENRVNIPEVVIMALEFPVPEPEILIFAPSADTYSNESLPDLNYGFASILRTDLSPLMRTYLRFQLDGLMEPITRVRLRMFAETSSNKGYEVFTLATSNWSEESLSYNNAPALGQLIAASSSFTLNQWVDTDVTPVVLGDGPLDLAVTTLSTTTIRFGSRESIDDRRPLLLVEIGGNSAPGGHTPDDKTIHTYLPIIQSD